MSDLASTPFVRWGNYKSTDANNPDVLELKVIGTETFQSEYSINSRVMLKDEIGSKWVEVILPLKSYDSRNARLLNLWTMYTRLGKLKHDRQFKLKTWLGMSATTKRPMRRFAFKF